MQESTPANDEVIKPIQSVETKESASELNLSIPEDAWISIGVGDPRITQDSVERGKMMSVLHYFMEDNPGTDIKFAILKMSHILSKLGVPAMGMNRLDQMYKYVTIQRSTRPH